VFSIRALQDVDIDEVLSLDAQLADDAGKPTHKNHAEVTINFDAALEAPPTVGATISGTTLDDNRNSTGGRHAVAGTGANDRIQGLAGRDEVIGNGGDDIAEGGSGVDVVTGDAGDDQVFADVQLTEAQIQVLITTSAAAPTAGVRPSRLYVNSSEWLQGGLGADTVVGTSGDDIVLGGGGKDLLVGGAGHDLLNGDDSYRPGDISTTYVDTAVGVGAPFNNFYSSIVSDPTLAGDDDVIYAGSGDDVVSALAGNDTVWGDDGNDIVSGGEADDSLFGGNGNDQIAGDSYGAIIGDAIAPAIGDDYIDGGGGADKLYGDGGSDTVVGGDGNDEIRGNNNIAVSGVSPTAQGDGDDYLIGGSGNDQLTGDSADDTLDGGDGDDTLLGDSDATPVAYQGADYLDGGNGSDALRGYAGDDTLIGGAGSDFMYGDAGNDYIDGATDGAGDPEAIDYAYGGDGNDIMVGALHIQSWFLGEAGDDELSGEGLLDGGDGKDTLTTHGEYGNFNDPTLLQGGNGDDNLFVLAGNATAYGDAGDDKLYGGDDLDFLFGDDGSDVITGGSGADYAFGGNDQDSLTGGEGADQLEGGDGVDDLYGDGGNDIQSGGQGDDTLDGGSGRNFLDGGAGHDTYLRNDTGADDFIGDQDESGVLIFGEGIEKAALTFRNGKNTAGQNAYIVIEGFAAGGSVVIAGSLDSYQFADGTSLTAQEAQALADASERPPMPVMAPLVPITGTPDDDVVTHASTPLEMDAGAGNDTISAGAGDDKLYGGVGNDRLVGGGGKNLLQGDDGVDTYVVSLADAGTRIVDHHVAASPEVDTIELAAGITPAQVRLIRNGQDLAVAMNGGSAQVVIASYFTTTQATQSGNVPADNKIESFKFADGTVWNSAQIAARIEAGSANAMTGTSGNDTFVVDDAGDTVTELANAGTDTIQSSVSYKLPANVERLVLTGVLDANAWANAGNAVSYLYGNDGNNVFDGPGAGFASGGIVNAYAVMAGGKGDDTYYYDRYKWGSAVENPGEGNDTIYLAGGAGDFVLPANIENAIDINGALGRPPGGADSMTGNALDNFLGYAGPGMGHISYYFDGGPGADTMQGFIDNDVYIVDNPGDRVIEAPIGGVQSPLDEIRASVTYQLPTNVEVLTLTGSSATDGWGNDAANTLDGSTNAEANHLYGGLGDDLYKVGVGDIVVERDGQGFDTVEFHGSGTRTYTADDLPLFAEGIALGDDLGASDVTAAGGDDVIKGNASANLLVAFAGDDKVDGNGGDDTLDGGPGDDTLQGGAGADTYRFAGGFGRDSIVDPVTDGRVNHIVFDASISVGDVYFQDGELRVEGTPDAIVLARPVASTGQIAVLTSADVTFADGSTIGSADFASVLTASFSSAPSAGADVLRGTAGDDVLDGLAGRDYVYGLGGNDALSGGDDADWVAGGEGNDTVNGNGGNDRLFGGVGVDRLDGGSEDDSIHGDDGDDVIAGGVDGDTLYGDAGNDRMDGGDGNDLISDLEGDNVASGGDGDDVINLGDGADTLDGGAGVDTLDGGAGDDTYVLARGIGSDWISEQWGNGDRTVVAVAGSVTPADVTVTRLDGTEYDHVSIAIAATGDELKVGVPDVAVGNLEIRFADGTVWSSSVINDKLYLRQGTAGNDVLTGTVSNDRLHGYAGNDTLSGLWGDDLLDGGSGADTMTGGDGNDTFVVDDVADVVTEAASQGNDVVQSSISYVLPVNVEELVLVGTASLNGTGNTLDNRLTGNAGDNLLDGKTGRDTMVGGAGNDTYAVDNAGDVVTESANGGTDAVQSSVTITLAAEVEYLTLTGSSAINGTGNAADNVLTGNAAANTLTGNAGDDQLNGGAGADTLRGGVGNDTYTVDNASDVVTELAGEGTDGVLASVTYTLAANVETLTLTGASAINATGNTLDNALTGNGAANVLTGGAGADTMSGGAGNDTYVVDNASDFVTEAAGQGTDLVQSSITYALGAEVENLTLTGASAINATGNGLANTLTGNTGNNVLDGGSGTDTLRGGAGNDTYRVDAAGDVITENLSEGIDVVQSSVTFALAANVENLTLTGAAAVNATGNTLDNVLTGNAADNVLTGAAGNDTMRGAAGNDTYVVDAATDIVTENAGEGTDLVQSAVTWTLGANVENLILTGTAAINGTGNTLANAITGNAANNVLDGGTGFDTLVGGAGNDTYVVDSAGDVVIEAAGAGTDLVNAGVTCTLAANVENLTLTGSTAINGTGNALSNTLSGNAANNVLDGGTGADTLVGGSGNDTYAVDNAGDVITEASGAGTDVVNASVTCALAANVENLTLTGAAAINGTGNALNNTLTGNAANNVLDGGSGTDTMAGGAGNDTYVVDVSADVTSEAAGGGTDLVQSAITWTLASEVENLTLTGASAVNGTGNALANALTGNAADNTLDGAAGADSMSGGAGNDTYVVDNVGDVITEAAGAGTDAITSSITFVTAANVEFLTLAGAAAVNGTGNTLDNWLRGNAAFNTLSGMDGNDTLWGDLGDDVMNGNNGNDLVQGGAGNDTLSDTAGNNVLDGGAGTDTITGGSARDMIIGGAGADTITTGGGADVIGFNKGNGADIVNASIGTDDTLTLGGGLAYSDLKLKKSGLDLILDASNGDQITFKDWYQTGVNNKSVLNLQVVADAMAAFNPAGTDPLLNKKLVQFNFSGIVNAFDAALAVDPTITSWNVSNALAGNYVSGSDVAAIGGDFAYDFGHRNALTDIGAGAAQAVLAGATFGTAAQTLQAAATLYSGTVRLN
jgi:Ca2+-binding RTX toxin-like protein